MNLAVAWSSAFRDAFPSDAVFASDTVSAKVAAGFETFELLPGLVTATVGKYRLELAVSELTDDAWDVLVGKSQNPATRARIVGGHLPEALLAQLLPKTAELHVRCSCGKAMTPCRHISGLEARIGEQFAAEPYALMTLRGRSRSELLAEILPSRAGESLDDDAISAAQAYRRKPNDPPTLPRLPLDIKTLPPLPTPPMASGVLPAELDLIARDASQRALNQLFGLGDSGLLLRPGSDVIRLAAQRGSAEIAKRTGIDENELESAARAWRFGGAQAVRALRHRWDAAIEQLQPGVEFFAGMGRLRANTVTLEESQLRIDESGGWWMFRLDEELGWLPTAGPSRDPYEL